jgi:hypothetical protein
MLRLLRTHLFLLLSLLTLTGLSGCAVNPATGRTELALIPVPTSQEIAIGEKTFPQAVQQMGGEYPDARLAAYVNQVGLRLCRASQRPELPYQFKVVNDSTPNVGHSVDVNGGEPHRAHLLVRVVKRPSSQVIGVHSPAELVRRLNDGDVHEAGLGKDRVCLQSSHSCAYNRD